jgi:putative tryptophan/tyrosine transport system substrate-binding protein
MIHPVIGLKIPPSLLLRTDLERSMSRLRTYPRLSIRRKTLIALRSLGLAALVVLAALPSVPRGADAQAPSKVRHVGILRLQNANDPTNDQIRQALREVGYVEGQNIRTEWRYADGRTEQLAPLAAELVRLEPDAIVAFGDPVLRAARRATSTIPIIGAAEDLVRQGHITSLARPGGNVTGVSILASELDVKRLEFLKQAVPRASRIAVLSDPDVTALHLDRLRSAAQSLGVQLNILEVRQEEDLPRMFRLARDGGAQAVHVLSSVTLQAFRRTIIDLAAKTRLPAIYQWDQSVREGGLLGYGPTLLGLYRAMSVQLDKVLNGANPAVLAAVQPSEFKLVVNMKTARALRLTIPPSLLARADEVIE